MHRTFVTKATTSRRRSLKRSRSVSAPRSRCSARTTSRRTAQLGQGSRTLAAIDRARTRGIGVACDAYPYVASWTELATVLPPRVREGGDDAALARLRDPDQPTAAALRDGARTRSAVRRRRLGHRVDHRRRQRAQRDIAGMRVDALAARWRTTPARAAIRLLVERRCGSSPSSSR